MVIMRTFGYDVGPLAGGASVLPPGARGFDSRRVHHFEKTLAFLDRFCIMYTQVVRLKT
jgi:hypothetical protein